MTRPTPGRRAALPAAMVAAAHRDFETLTDVWLTLQTRDPPDGRGCHSVRGHEASRPDMKPRDQKGRIVIDIEPARDPAVRETHHLVGVQEIAELVFRVIRARVVGLTCRDDFPAPIADLAEGAVWDRADVEAWFDSGSTGSAAGAGVDEDLTSTLDRVTRRLLG